MPLFFFFWRVSSDTQSNVIFIADLRQQNCLVDNIFSIHVFGPVLFRFYQTSACTYSSSVKSILVQIIYYFPMAIFVIFPHCIFIKDVFRSKTKIRVESHGLEKSLYTPYNIRFWTIISLPLRLYHKKTYR